MAGMEGAATFVRHSILDISVHMWYLNSMDSLHSSRPGYFSYKLCGQTAELCGVLQTFIKQFYLSSFVKKRKLCRDNDWNKLVSAGISLIAAYTLVQWSRKKTFFPIPSQKCNYEKDKTNEHVYVCFVCYSLQLCNYPVYRASILVLTYLCL